MTSRSRSAISCVVLMCVAQLVSAATKTSGTKHQAPPQVKVQSEQDLGFFAGSRGETLAQIKRVGVLEPWLPVGFEDREDAKRALQNLIVDYLHKSNIDAIGPEAFTASFDRLNHEVGGIYDPKTGAMKPDASKAVYANARREFIESQHLDGYVITRVVPVKARFMAGFATWDGVKERIDGHADKFMDFQDSAHEGTLPALSLVIQIANAQDKIVFGCVFRRWRPGIPRDGGHLFRRMAAGCVRV